MFRASNGFGFDQCACSLSYRHNTSSSESTAQVRHHPRPRPPRLRTSTPWPSAGWMARLFLKIYRSRLHSSDTVPRVIQPRVRRGPQSSPEPSVNNSAAPVMKCGEKVVRSGHSCRGRIAPGGSRSHSSNPTRISQSSPARPAASVSTSERTIALEAPGIRSTPDGATMRKQKPTPMKLWQELTHYAGFYWAKDHHAVKLRYFAGMSNEEASQVLGISLSTLNNFSRLAVQANPRQINPSASRLLCHLRRCQTPQFIVTRSSSFSAA